MLLIRDARLGDMPAIEEMVEDFVKGHPAQGHPRSPDALRRAYFGERPVTHLLVAERGGDIVGMGVLAGLEGLPVREIVRRLPGPELSRQPPDP